MKKSQINVILTAGVVALLLFSGCVSGIVSTFQSTTTGTSRQKNNTANSDAIITCYVSGIPHSQTISYESGAYLKELFSELVTANAHDPCSFDTERLQQQILVYAEQQGLLPAGMSADMVFTQLKKQGQIFAAKAVNGKTAYPLGIGKELFCNFVATGEGSAFPIIILPRFIPFIMTPIPRLFVGWKTSAGFTSVGGLMSGTGFYAAGQQQGFALGFWGIGFSIFLPPVRAYGMFGYALYAKASAEYMEYYPPNNPPEITQTDPADGQQMVPTTLTELRFEIDDLDNDLMSYNVTTEPDIGSGSGGLKPGGTYSIPISGLESLTNYSWYIQVTDGKDTVNKICSFKTEPTTPILSNPLPPDGERDVPIDLSELRFTLKDYQGDTMGYTVQTSPNIGSAQGSDVHDGTYTVPISGMTYGATYRWYVNVTDGVHWTRKIFAFETGYPAQFNPFDFGWQYRKQITIDHTKVLDDLTNFPVLIRTTDTSLLQKAQTDGGDIMFMNDVGVSTRVYHDLESYDASSGTLITWVNIPYLSSINDTVFYIYYGNPDCINQAYPEKTWDSNYEAVWHMNDATPMTITDSTLHDYTGTKIAPYEPHETTGKIGEGQEFDGANDNIWINGHSVLGIGEKTVSFWMISDVNSNYQTILTNALGGTLKDAGLDIAVQNPGNEITSLIGNGATNEYYLFIDKILPDHTIYHYYVSRQCGSNLSLYLDGSLSAWTTSTSGSESEPTNNMSIGRSHQNPPYFYWFDGRLDEIRMSDVARSASWINTEYNNQDSPSTFLTFGPEEPHP